MRLPNVKYIIHQIGSQERHGVPYHLNRKIWELFIEELLPGNDVSLIKYRSSDDLHHHPFVRDADVVVIIRGNEYSNIKKEEQTFLQRYQPTIDHFNHRGIKLYYNFLDRPDAKKLCATAMISELKRYQGKYRNCHCRECVKRISHRMRKFLPSKLSSRTVRYIVHNLLKHV
jgi:hypothetical protein